MVDIVGRSAVGERLMVINEAGPGPDSLRHFATSESR
jgi:hypothetical protein